MQKELMLPRSPSGRVRLNCLSKGFQSDSRSVLFQCGLLQPMRSSRLLSPPSLKPHYSQWLKTSRYGPGYVHTAVSQCLHNPWKASTGNSLPEQTPMPRPFAAQHCSSAFVQGIDDLMEYFGPRSGFAKKTSKPAPPQASQVMKT